MKKLYHLLTATFLIIPALFTGQTAISITSGDWTNPFTWNCTCVPVNGYSVIINHNVTLNTSMSFSSGGVAIGSTGSLVQDASANRDIWINGGSFANAGTADFRHFLLSTGNGSNSGTFALNAFSNSAAFINSGTLYMDSMEVLASFNNTVSGRIFGDSIRNSGTVTNDGRMNIVWVTNSNQWVNNNYQSGFSMTNLGVYENNDTLLLSNSFWNANRFFNNPNSTAIMYNDFFNANTINNAVFDNQGMVNVYDSWYNTDTIKGTNAGYFSVGDTSANSGFMKGSFEFCDLTPPASAPFVDLNSGTIDPNITWCTAVGIKHKEDEKSVVVFPNPSSGTFSVKGTAASSVTITDELGRIIYTALPNKNNNLSFEITDLESGIYFLRSGENNICTKIIVTK